MEPDTGRTDTFWCGYRRTLAAEGVCGKTADWYVKHAKGFTESMRRITLCKVVSEDVKAYLRKVVNRWNLQATTD